MSINRVLITGNLTRDPELRSTASGLPVLALGVAVNDRRRNQQTGEWEDYPNFIDCTMFGARAESVSRFLSKGSKVAIEGKLRWSQWEREGQKRSKIEVIIDEIEFMNRNNGQDGASPASATYASAGTASAASAAYGAGAAQPSEPAPAAPMAEPAVDASVYDSDIPF